MSDSDPLLPDLTGNYAYHFVTIFTLACSPANTQPYCMFDLSSQKCKM